MLNYIIVHPIVWLWASTDCKICTSIVTNVNFRNYSPLLPDVKQQKLSDSVQIGLQLSHVWMN